MDDLRDYDMGHVREGRMEGRRSQGVVESGMRDQ